MTEGTWTVAAERRARGLISAIIGTALAIWAVLTGVLALIVLAQGIPKEEAYASDTVSSVAQLYASLVMFGALPVFVIAIAGGVLALNWGRWRMALVCLVAWITVTIASIPWLGFGW